MRRAYKFLLQPTSRQQRLLSEMLSDLCAMYNCALEDRRNSWRERAVSVSLGDQSAQLPTIRATMPEYARWAANVEQDVLRRLDHAYQAFFRRARDGETPGFPRFKGRGWYDSATFDVGKGGCRWDTSDAGVGRMRRGRRFKFRTTTVYLQGIGHVKVRQHRAVEGTVKTITVKREGRRWFVVLSCDGVPAKPLPETGREVGVDLGISLLAMTSDGEAIENPRHARSAQETVATIQQSMSRKRRGSSRRARDRARLTKAHRKVRDQRNDFQHKAALELVRRYDVLYFEDLKPSNMTRKPKPKPDGEGGFLPNGAAAKGGLNRSINDAAWAGFVSKVCDKAESAGRRVVFVNPAYTSQTCTECGHVSPENREGIKFACVACGFIDHADHVGATNILRRGQGLTSSDGVLAVESAVLA